MYVFKKLKDLDLANHTNLKKKLTHTTKRTIIKIIDILENID
jgi:hypothetical protein